MGDHIHSHDEEHNHMHTHGFTHGHIHENQKAVVNRLARAIGHLEKTIQYAQGNVSPAAICGYLGWHLR